MRERKKKYKTMSTVNLTEMKLCNPPSIPIN